MEEHIPLNFKPNEKRNMDIKCTFCNKDNSKLV